MTALVNTSGAVVERNAYTPYGVVTVLDANWVTRSSSAYDWMYLRQGTRRDFTTNLDDSRYRIYNVALGRPLQTDPLGYGAGDTNLNRWEGNSPIGAVDPSGEFVHILVGAGIGAVVGVGGRFVGDLMTGRSSSWSEYVGAGVGGAAGGAVLAGTGNPALAGAASGFAGNLTTQVGRNIAGEQQGVNTGQLLVSTGAGAAAGYAGGTVARAAGPVAESALVHSGLGRLAQPVTIGAFQGGAGGLVGGYVGGAIHGGWQHGTIAGAMQGGRQGALIGGITGTAQGAIVGGYYQIRPWRDVSANQTINGHGDALGGGEFLVPAGSSVRLFTRHGHQLSYGLARAVQQGRIPADASVRIFGPGESMPNYRYQERHYQPPQTLANMIFANQGTVNFNACTNFSVYNPIDSLTQHRLYNPIYVGY